MTRYLTLAAAVLVLAPQAAAAQEHDHSTHAGKETREIKALSAEDVQNYLAGEGMGLALAAELNRYPGPRHVLDLAAELRLSERQVTDVRRILEEMKAEAVKLGTEYVARERELDQAFARRTIDEVALRRMTGELGRLTAELRNGHLRAHLRTTALLTHEQIMQYDALRGYAGGGGHQQH
jgi:hypothetical protein